MNQSTLIITDKVVWVQEEAPSLGKPVSVRDTERPIKGWGDGLVGADKDRDYIRSLIINDKVLNRAERIT
jgi:UDP-N-acetylglucosamine 2-epimerase